MKKYDFKNQFIDYLMNMHEYVEIGGVKWATKNIGAEKETDCGLYFQWGDISGYTAAQVGDGEGLKYFSWEDYKYDNGRATELAKYNATDKKTGLNTVDDAAQAALGGSWRMPTKAEFQLLGSLVNTARTDNYNNSGVAGIVCTDKTDSSKVLFFPAAGYCYAGRVRNVGSCGNYWSSSLDSKDIDFAYDLGFYGGNVYWDDYDSRCFGIPVRPIFAL